MCPQRIVSKTLSWDVAKVSYGHDYAGFDLGFHLHHSLLVNPWCICGVLLRLVESKTPGVTLGVTPVVSLLACPGRSRRKEGSRSWDHCPSKCCLNAWLTTCVMVKPSRSAWRLIASIQRRSTWKVMRSRLSKSSKRPLNRPT